jgi:hypothetical protein
MPTTVRWSSLVCRGGPKLRGPVMGGVEGPMRVETFTLSVNASAAGRRRDLVTGAWRRGLTGGVSDVAATRVYGFCWPVGASGE